VLLAQPSEHPVFAGPQALLAPVWNLELLQETDQSLCGFGDRGWR
jgi:hypothetical protein